jgi:hypothetical protein
MKKLNYIKILIICLTISISGCGNDIANKGGGNTNTNDNDTIIISNIASDNDTTKISKCESCIIELENQSECVCLATIGCTVEDISACIDCEQYIESCELEEEPIIEDEFLPLGEDLSEGAL